MNDHDLRTYLSATSEWLFTRLATVTNDLVAKNRELGFIEAQFIRTKHDAYYQSVEHTHVGRERDADAATLEFRVAIAEGKAEVAALNDEKFFILRLLDRS